MTVVCPRGGKKLNRMFRINFVFCTTYLRIGLATRYSHELNNLVRLVRHVQVHLIVPKSANAGRQMNATPWLWSAHTLHTQRERGRGTEQGGRVCQTGSDSERKRKPSVAQGRLLAEQGSMAVVREFQQGSRCHRKTWINIILGILPLLLPCVQRGGAQLQGLEKYMFFF